MKKFIRFIGKVIMLSFYLAMTYFIVKGMVAVLRTDILMGVIK